MGGDAVKGSRKYRFALVCLAALCAGFAAASVFKTPADIWDGFVWGLFALVFGHGGANGLEHFAEALKYRRGGKP